jgi:hypothetical protein
VVGGDDPSRSDRQAGCHEQGGEPLSHYQAASGRVRFVVCLIVIVAVGAGAELATLPRADIAFLLYTAERVLDGARLYVDIVEINPPLIVALNLPAVLLARATGAPDVLVYRLLVTAALLCGLALAAWSLRWSLDDGKVGFRRGVVLVLAFALFLAAGDDFGQREHLLVALALPYVLLAVGRTEGRPAPRAPAFAAGVLAGVGLALKPHFLLVWAALEGYVWWRRRPGRLSPEVLGVAAIVTAYVAGVALLTPEYFRLLPILGPAYAGYGHYPFVQVLVTAPGTALCLLAGLAWIALRRQANHPELWTLVLLALVSSFVGGAAQQKGWGYHFYPARVFALVLLALTVLDVRHPLPRTVQRVYSAVAFAALGTSVVWSVVVGVGRIMGRDSERRLEQARLDELVAAVHRHTAPGGSLYGLSYTIESGFPLVNYSGVRWASRFPHLWIIESVYQDQLYAPGPLRFHTREQMGPAERYLNDAVGQDLSRNRPDVLMVLRPARDTLGNAIRRVDYVGYFARDPRIARELRQYRFAEEVGEYLLYVRARSPGEPGMPPEPEPGKYDVARTGASAGAATLVADRTFVLKLVTFLLLGAVGLALERRQSYRAAWTSVRQGPA